MTRLTVHGASTAQVLERVLGEPGLVHAIRALSATELGELVSAVGLEDAGEVVALASTEQIAGLFDGDLWQSGEEAEERFDARRFGLWLEVLSEAGEVAVAQRLTELPLDFLCMAMHRLVLVLDMDTLGQEFQQGGVEDADGVEKALESQLFEEWEEFRIIDRGLAPWDTVMGALLALDQAHTDVLRALLERCCQLSTSTIEDNGGLYEVLTEPERIETDQRAERDDRRTRQGYVSLSDARAFLRLAARGIEYRTARDPVTAAHFREQSQREPAGRQAPPSLARRLPAGVAEPLSELIRASQGELAAPTANIRRQLAEADAKSASGVGMLEAALASLAQQAPAAHEQRRLELAYLANVLLSASASLERHLRPVEAIEIAVAAVERGIAVELSGKQATRPRPRAAALLLAETGLDVLFRVGWHRFAKQPEPDSALSDELEKIAWALMAEG